MDLAPYSGAIEAGSNLVNAVVSRIWPDKTKIAEIQGEIAKQIAAGDYANELASIQNVNATMQAEAKSEHWAQWLWRPCIGFAFALETGGLGIVFTLLLGRLVLGYTLPPDIIPEVTGLVGAFSILFAAQGAILGAAAAGRSFEKWQKGGK
jgi:hypothetical protein